MPQFTLDIDDLGRLLFNDTELIAPEDQNDLQRLVGRQIAGHLLSSLHGVFQFKFSGGSTPELKTIGDGLRANVSATNLEMKFGSGSALWYPPTPRPDSPNEWPLIWASEGPISLGFADAADGTFDRFDIVTALVTDDITDVADEEARHFKDLTGAISSQNFRKRHRKRLTLKYIPGTPAASPVEPAVPAGEVKIARFVVRAAQTAIAFTDIRDFRQPLGWQRVKVEQGAAVLVGASVLDVVGWGIVVGPAGDFVRYPLNAIQGNNTEILGGAQRLKQILVNHQLAVGAVVLLRRHNRLGPGFTTILDVTGQLTIDGTPHQDIIVVDETGEPGAVWDAGHPEATFLDALSRSTVLLEFNGPSGPPFSRIDGVEALWYGSF